MIVWLINPYGPIPSEDWRSYCFPMIANALVKRGHNVIWWTSNFSHHFKKFRSNGWKDIKIDSNFIIRLVPTPAYRNNIGIGRIFRDALFAYRTYSRGKNLLPPDCILYSESPLTFGYAGQKLSKYHNTPLVCHQMDLWAELFEQVIPRAIRPFTRFLLLPIYANRRKIFAQLDALVALAQTYLEVPLREAPVLRSRPHAVIYNGIDVRAFREFMKRSSECIPQLPKKSKDEIWAIFAGSLGPSYDILSLIRASRKLKQHGNIIKIVIAGDGPLRAQVIAASVEQSSSLIYVGQLSPKKLATLYSSCDIGICAYSLNSNVEMPDKIYDYTAAGLPVINSLHGEVKDVIHINGIGIQYKGGNVQSLTDALLELASDNSLREAMAKRSYEVGMSFDKNLQFGRLALLIEKLESR